ncbi:LicD family-domain-containing protein [Aspergillus avenaceus]|uniref:LicD family-domain-containing protein n=1 Tax=Aspergillus avenaceus TaxID=36643 RepID=A0A5N6U744_ASPAV|nr:LicD family-domain-containing protein [Aspergillus avenaceus]
MRFRDLLTLTGAIWSAVTEASPEPVAGTAEHSAYGKVVNVNDPDPLWAKYGLNSSAEFKYFVEPGHDDILGHYDSRFFTEPVADEKRSQTMVDMVRAYLNFFDENGLETWIAHGTLLGWWWNTKIMPWDWDMDTQVLDTTLFQLADRYNQSVVQYSPKSSDATRSYLLDINPWARQRVNGTGLNIIDARWIDMQTGLYIDITGVSKIHPEKPDVWEDKHKHTYRTGELYPLRKTTFEGVAAKVPFQYEAILIQEYGKNSLTTTHFHNHTWTPESNEWVPDKVADADADADEKQYE